tara:strand:+ start:583 stop:828 length:246 start_codon:yes stop_codon:yes gene_type:complete
MYRKGELVEVKEHRLKTHTTAIGSSWDVIWLPGIIIQWHGKTKMRTGLSRFEDLDVASVFIGGKIKKIPTRNLRYPLYSKD